MPRPKPVTVISWLFIVGSTLSLIRKPFHKVNPAVNEMLARSPLPVPFHHVISCVHLIVLLTCGIAMLKAQNWGRYLYVVWGAINIVVGLAVSPVRLILIPGILVYALFVFLLFRPEASRYFTKRAEPSAGGNAAAPRASA